MRGGAEIAGKRYNRGQAMAQWWEETRWLRLHVLAAPFGVFAATLLYTLYLEQWQWQGRASWALAGEQVDMGAVLYGMAAVAAERSVVFMFWALAQRRKWQERLREEGRQEADAAAEKRFEQWLSKVSKERNIPLEELMPPKEGSQR